MQSNRNLERLLIFTLLLSVFLSDVCASNKATEMTNDAIGRAPTLIKVTDPAAYYADRVKAIELARQENWAAARPLLERLTREYKDDGAIWYVLGVACFQLEEWEHSINALENALELGSFLHHIPTASGNPNDLMMKIAEAYARSGDEENAIIWINKSLAARWDDRPTLAGSSLFQEGKNPNFSKFETSVVFQKLSGSYLDDTLSRDDGWRQDLKYLVSEIKRLHVNMYHRTRPEDFQSKVDTIDKQIPLLTDRQVVFEFMQLLALTGNGHNLIIPAWGTKGSFLQLPMLFYWFSDGLYIIEADQEYEQWIGSKVERIGNTDAEEALLRTKSVNARDNEMQQHWLGPYYLSLTSVLEGLNIVDSDDNVTLTLTSPAGVTSTIRPKATPMTFQGFPKLAPLNKLESPRYLSRNTEYYWFELLMETHALYVQFNDVIEKPSPSIKEFNQLLREQITEGGVDQFILDLRHNSGGDGSLMIPMITTMVMFEALKPDGKLFVLVGRNTFSAAHNLLVDITRLTNVIVVGEPSGSRPNALSESGWFNLPYSRQTGIISSQFFQVDGPEDHRIWVAPDVPVGLSSEKYFSGEDPVMDAVFSIIGDVRH